MTPAERIQNTGFRAFVIIGIILAAAYYYSVFDDGASIDHQSNDLHQQIQKTEADLASAKQIASDQGRFQAEVDHTSGQLKLALELLPTSAKVEDVLDKMSKEAAAAGVRMRGSAPKAPENKGFYDELKVDVTMEGSFPNLTLFLSYISSRRIHRIITLRDLELAQKGGDSSTLTMHGTLVAYRYVEGKP